MAKFLGRYESGTPEWHELRKGCLGGSQVGAVLGLNPWESAVATFYKVTGQISSDIPVSRNMRLGTLLEKGMFENFVAEHPDWKCVYQPGTYAHDDYPQFRSNPDILVENEDGHGVVDLKFSSDFWTDVPAHYVAQVRWYMWIHNLQWGMIAGLIGGRWQEFKIERDLFAEEVMVEQVLRFWGNVERLERPEWDGSDSTYQTMRALNRDVSDEGVELGEQGEALIACTEAFEQATANLNFIRSQVLFEMQNAKYGLLNGERICYRQKSSTGVPFLKMKG